MGVKLLVNSKGKEQNANPSFFEHFFSFYIMNCLTFCIRVSLGPAGEGDLEREVRGRYVEQHLHIRKAAFLFESRNLHLLIERV